MRPRGGHEITKLKGKLWDSLGCSKWIAPPDPMNFAPDPVGFAPDPMGFTSDPLDFQNLLKDLSL